MKKEFDAPNPPRAERMIARKAAGWAGALLMAGFVAGGGAASGESLDQALATAYQANPSLRASRASLRATDNLVPQALSDWRPTVAVDGEYGRAASNSENRVFNTSDDLEPSLARLSVNQPLFRGFRTVQGTRRAENLVQAERALLLDAEQNVLLDAAAAYMDVLRDQAVLELEVSNEQVLRRHLEATEDRFRVGEVTRTDVSQAEARLSGATADRIQSEGDLEASRAVYGNIVGQVPGKLERPDPLRQLPENEEQIIDTAIKGHPQVLTALFLERAAEAETRTVAGEMLPELSLGAELSRVEDSFSEDSVQEGASIVARLRIPLYQAGSVSARVREARQRANQRRIEIEQARRFARQEATRAWEGLQTARARIDSFKSQINANEIALEGVQQEALVGSRTVLDTLDAEQELLDSRVNLVRAQRDEIVARFQVKAAMGELTAQTLALPVEYYDPTEHYEEVRNKIWGFGPGDSE